VLSRLDQHIHAQLPHLRSLLIARHGRLVFENYYGDASRNGLQNMQSMTKTVSSALVGVALRKGFITSLDNRVVDYLLEYRRVIQDDRMNDITIRHIMTMSSGIDEVRLSFDRAFANPDEEILRWRLLFEPGRGFKYSSTAAHLLGGVLRAVSGQSVLDFARAEFVPPSWDGRSRLVYGQDGFAVRRHERIMALLGPVEAWRVVPQGRRLAGAHNHPG
jgi:CubicO group peptidase (beta-lactamase class C family)